MQYVHVYWVRQIYDAVFLKLKVISVLSDILLKVKPHAVFCCSDREPGDGLLFCFSTLLFLY